MDRAREDNKPLSLRGEPVDAERWTNLGNLFYYLTRIADWALELFFLPFKKICEADSVKIIDTNATNPSNNAGGNDVHVRPLSVNYHFPRQCNFKCGFCFHTAKSSFVLPLEEAMKGLRLLKEAGMEKINFSGGEPFIHQKGRYLGQLVRYCKVQLGLPSVSIVSNGSLITESWFRDFGQHLDILAISCDSFDIETNVSIGRKTKIPQNNWETLQRIRGWCRDYKVAFKINTVVNTINLGENMKEHIAILNPVRWKVFQCLLIDGENQGEEALRNAKRFTITDEQFEKFLELHSSLGSIVVPESNAKMRNSYLILDERMRFLDCTGGEKKPSPSILDVGEDSAITSSGFDEEMFFSRGGKYVWTKEAMDPSQLDW